MSNDTVVTLQGWLGGEVTLRRAGESPVASFRVGCTPRRFQRRSETWVDEETQWYTVNAWRALGEHCAASLHAGDPVVVHGRLSARTYVSRSDVEVTAQEVEATFVGHDLTRGTTTFIRAAPRASSQVPSQEAVQEAVQGPAQEGADAAA